MKFIHFGDSHFSREKFNPIENHGHWFKPKGGLWGSPVFTEFSWKQWCIDNNFKLDKLSEYFYFILTSDARVLTVKSSSDLERLPKIPETENFRGSTFLDFEKLKQDYDALIVLFGGDLDFESLLSWDCDSILVLNPDVVREVPKYEYVLNGIKLQIEDLAAISNYYHAACTAESLIENHPEIDTLEKAMAIGYEVRNLMCRQGLEAHEAINQALRHFDL